MLCPSAWRNRFHPNVEHVFRTIWDAVQSGVELRVKEDRYGVMRPLHKSEWRTDEGWLHTDQNPKMERDFIRVQGILTFTDSTVESGGGFICVPGFHREEWVSYCDRNPIDQDVCLLTREEQKVLLPHAEKITAQPGSLIVWDSRLPHANFPNESTTAWRMVQYITYYPAHYDSEKRVRIRREDASVVRQIMEERYSMRLFTPHQYRLMGGE